MSKDYSDYEKRPQSSDAMAQLAQLATSQLKADADVAKAEDALKTAKEVFQEIAEIQIPELMDQLGVTAYTTTNGLKITVGEKVRASISAKSKNAAFQWLRDNGHAALIKREIKMLFGMGEDVTAKRALELLKDLPVEDSSSVHAQTLGKFVGEMLSDGKPVPEELFNIHRQRFTKVKV